MRCTCLILIAAVCCAGLTGPLFAQGGWVTPQPPCELSAGHFKVNGGILYLKTAAEKPERRDQQLEQARKVLTEAIVQNAQDKNAAAWYYLGRYYVETADAAGADSALARALALAPQCKQILVGRAQSDPAALGYARLRASIDSIDRGFETDSTTLARMIASSQSRKARGRRLTPADQQTFTRDSTARAQAVAQARTARATVVQQMAADSGKLWAAFAPAIEALRDYLTAYPGEADAATSLATLYAQSGRAAEAAAMFDSLAAHARNFDPEELFTAGQRLLGQRLYRAGTRALAVALTRNPYRRDALYSLGVGYYQLRDSTGLLEVAQRLVQLDPLNRSSLTLLAAAWDLPGKRDSTLKYVTQADSLVAVEVTVSSFVPDSAGAALTLLATNLRPAPSKPFRLTVEFLDRQGKPVASEARELPAIAPQESQQLDLKVSGKGIIGWRYRPS